MKKIKRAPFEFLDKDGAIRTPRVVYGAIVFLMKGLLVFIASMGPGGKTNEILSFFYPDGRYLYLDLVFAFIGLGLIAIVNRLRETESLWIVKFCAQLKPVLVGLIGLKLGSWLIFQALFGVVVNLWLSVTVFVALLLLNKIRIDDNLFFFIEEVKNRIAEFSKPDEDTTDESNEQSKKAAGGGSNE